MGYYKINLFFVHLFFEWKQLFYTFFGDLMFILNYVMFILNAYLIHLDLDLYIWLQRFS